MRRLAAAASALRAVGARSAAPAIAGAAQAQRSAGATLLDDFDDLVGVDASPRPTTSRRRCARSTASTAARCASTSTSAASPATSRARRMLPIEFPARYEFALATCAADAPPNALQIKLDRRERQQRLVGPQRPSTGPPPTGRRCGCASARSSSRGARPADRALRRTAAVELVIASGSGAGKGSVCFDRLELRELPARRTDAVGAGRARRASFAGPITRRRNAVDGRAAHRLAADRSRAAAAVLTVDYGAAREFGALALRWRPGAAASRYAIELSDDGEHWRTRAPRRARARRRCRSTGCPSRRRASCASRSTSRPRKASRWPSSSCGRALDAERVLRRSSRSDAPRGRYPRAYVGEQSYWTVLGVDGATHRVAAERRRRARAGAGCRRARAVPRRRRQAC